MDWGATMTPVVGGDAGGGTVGKGLAWGSAGGTFAAYKRAFEAHDVTPTGPRARVPSSLELIALRKKKLLATV